MQGQEVIRMASECLDVQKRQAFYLTLPWNSRVIVVLQILLLDWVCNFRQVWDRLYEPRRGAAAIAFTALHELWLDLRRI